MSSWRERRRSLGSAGLLKGRAAVALWLLALPALAAPGAPTPDDEDEENVPVTTGSKGGGETGSQLQPQKATPGRSGETSEAVAWGIPPLPWRAQLSLSGGASLRADGGSTHFFSKSLGAYTASYIWQPWFARLNGSANFTQSDTYDSSGMGRGEGVSGDLGMDLLPSSRFPVSMSFGQSETDAKSRSASSSTTARRFTVNQRYTPLADVYHLGWGYSWARLSSSAGGRSEVQNLNANFGQPLLGGNPQSIAASTAWSSFRNSASGASSGNGLVNVTHTVYFEDYVLSLTNDAHMSVNRVHSSTEPTAESQVAQAGSVFDWVPDDDSPLRLSGNMRVFNTRTLTRGQGSQVSTLNGGLNASYPLDRHWSFGGGVNALETWQKSDAQGSAKNRTLMSTALASWSGDGWRTKFDEWAYSLSYGSSSSLTATHARDSGGATSSMTRLGVSSSVGQSLGRGVRLEGYRVPVQLSLSQGYGVSKSSGADLSHSLNHGFNVSWQHAPGPDTQMTFTASVSDSRSFSEHTTAYQQAQSAIQGSTALSGYSSVNTIFSLQFNRQATSSPQASGGSGWQGSAAGSVGYNHSRFGDVTGLRYDARYGIGIRPSLDGGGQPGQKTIEFDHQFSQGWAWRLGLLGWRIENAISYDAGGRAAASVFLSVTRDFSGVL